MLPESVTSVRLRSDTAGSGFRWTQSGGTEHAANVIRLYNVSGDGSCCVGTLSFPSGRYQPVQWTSAGVTGLGSLPGGTSTSGNRGEAYAASWDGSVIVGKSPTATGGEAFRWTASGGMIGLGNLPNGGWSQARGVSADGAIIAGYGRNAANDYEAFRWTAETGMVGLGGLSSSVWSVAYDISADGSTIVGCTRTANGDEAFRWTAATGMIALGDFDGGDHLSSANAVSADGSVIVGGGCMQGTVGGASEPFIWTAAAGMCSLRSLLGNAAPTGWVRLGPAEGVTVNNGIATIVGWGEDSSGSGRAWIATVAVPVPEPGTCTILASGLAAIAALKKKRRS